MLTSRLGVDIVVTKSESAHGQDSFWNSLYRNQEIVYRGQKPDRILWIVNSIDDGLNSGKYQNDEISVPMLKTGQRSVSAPSRVHGPHPAFHPASVVHILRHPAACSGPLASMDRRQRPP